MGMGSSSVSLKASALLAASLLAGGLIPAAQASAAPVWSAPQNISASANDLSGSSVAVDRHGRALAAWPAFRWQSGKPHGHYVLSGWSTATRAPGAAAFSLPRGAPTFVSGPVLFGVSRAIGLDQRSLGWQRCGERATLRARFGTSSGVFQAPITIVTSKGPGNNGQPAVAANDAGQVLVAWASANSDCSRSGIQISIRRPSGSSFGAPVTLRGSGRSEAPSVAVGAGGDMLVAWERRLGESRTAIEARFRQAGHGWGPVVTLGSGTVAGPLTTAVAQNGRAYVAWGSQTISESTGLTAASFVAVRPAGGRSFRAAQTLERMKTAVAYLPRLAPVLALAGTNAYVAWTGHDTAWRARVSRTDASGHFSAAQSPSPAGTNVALGGLAALPDGTAAMTWSGLDSENLVKDVVAAVRPAGASAFGAPELVSGAALRLPSVALDLTTRQPTVTWAQRVGAVTSVASITAYVRASTRSEGGATP